MVVKALHSSPATWVLCQEIFGDLNVIEQVASGRVRWRKFTRFQKQNTPKLQPRILGYFQAQGRRLVRQITETNIYGVESILDWRREGMALEALLRPTYTEGWLHGHDMADRQVGAMLGQRESIFEQKTIIAGPGISLREQSVDVDLIAIEGAREAIDDALELLTGSVSNTTKDQIRDVLSQGIEGGWDIRRIRNGILEVFHTSDGRALNIARTEIIRALNSGARTAYVDSGFMRDTNQNFQVPEGALDSKGKPIRQLDGPIDTPPAHPHCRCAIALDPDSGILEWLIAPGACEICQAIFGDNQNLLKAA